jgi:hypothetical protein
VASPAARRPARPCARERPGGFAWDLASLDIKICLYVSPAAGNTISEILVADIAKGPA